MIARLFAAGLLVVPQGALAMNCDVSRIVYVGQEDRNEEITFDRSTLELVYSYKGKVTRYVTGGNGTGVSVRSAVVPGGPDYLDGAYFDVDISAYAKPGAPDHLLIFHNGVYVPECR